MATDENTLFKIMKSCGIEIFGFACFDDLRNNLIPSSKVRFLPKDAKTVITALFPYYSGIEKGNISKYAVPEDYHLITNHFLDIAALRLKQSFGSYDFVPFCDASPIPEVRAALLAGLGCLGQNGLLIHPEYGSYVFYSEITPTGFYHAISIYTI